MRDRWLTVVVVCLALVGCDLTRSLVPSVKGASPAVPGQFPDPSVIPTSVPLVAGRGQVLDASGKPVAGARVRVFDSWAVPDGLPAGLLDSRANPLVSNNTGSLRTQAVSEAVTDASGRFSLSVPAGQYNLEAAAADGQTKAWQANLSVRSDGDLQTGPLTLLPTGRISGRVSVEDPVVTDLLKAQVFIPGSSYAANTTIDGKYVLSDVPSGMFPLFAWHPTLGEAYLDASNSVRVESSRTAVAPQLVLRHRLPVVEKIVAAGTDRVVEAVAPGTSLELVGRDFGASQGRIFKVAIQGVLVPSAERLSDSRIRFTVPGDATNGKVTLEVDGWFDPRSDWKLRILKSVVWKQPDLQLSLDATADLSVLLDVRDTKGDRVVPVWDGGRLIQRAAEVSFSANESSLIYVGADGVLQALSEGKSTVTVRAGSLPPQNLTVTTVPVGPNGPTPNPAVTPTAMPSQHPAPTSAATPTPAASSGPIPQLGPPGKLAPDDPGSATLHRDYVVTKNGVSSTFVWVPVFQAYQLINPANCGHAGQPEGVWVANQPSSGTRDVDWAVETFGGFYAGKYEASHVDAVPGDTSTGAGATEGASSVLKVAPFCMPWTNVNWDEAKEACRAYDPACHLMTDDEWTALAVWSMIRGVTVHGNNSSGMDANDNGITFTGDPTSWGRGLTGSG
ncbi:MAG: hypothetical protein VKP72_12605, partial [bacterium]|nr:hypothetical protein [bacterium]